MHVIRPIQLLLAALTTIMSSAISLAEDTDMLALGETLLAENCGGCHAVGTEDTNTHQDAPAFRTLSVNYPVEQLAESLAEGIQTGHPDMPEFAFSVEEIDAILAWLESIQEQ